MDTLTIVFDSDRTYIDLLTTISCSRIQSDEIYFQKTKNFLKDGFKHCVEFTVRDPLIIVPDDTAWTSGTGLRILHHVFFFKKIVEKSLVHNISIGFKSGEVRYIGVHQLYCSHSPIPPVLVASAFTSDQLLAWIKLFWDKKNGYSLSHPYAAFYPEFM